MNTFNFDANNEESLAKFVYNFTRITQKQLTNDESLAVLGKAIECLKQIREDEYKTKKNRLLLVIVRKLTNLKPTTIHDKIIEDGLIKVYETQIKYFLRSSNWDAWFLMTIYTTLPNILRTWPIINAYIEHNIVDLTVQILRKVDFISEKNLKDNNMYLLYDSIVLFLYLIASYAKEKLNELCLTSYIYKQLESLSVKVPVRKEILYIKANLCTILVIIQDESVIEKLKISDEIVRSLMRALIRITRKDKSSRARELYNNTQFWVEQQISTEVTQYLTGEQILQKLKIALRNECFKSKLFNSNLINFITLFLEKGNGEEIELSCEIMCLLCFNNYVVEFLKTNNYLVESIKKIAQETKRRDTKRYCKQILDSIDPDLDQRLQSIQQSVNFKSELIMIVCTHDYTKLGSDMGEELKKMGYTAQVNILPKTDDKITNATENAIEKALIVLFCYCDEYKYVAWCRYYVSYAIKLNKPMVFVKVQRNYEADGWLSSLLESKLQVDFSGGFLYDTCFERLVRRMKKTLYSYKCALVGSDSSSTLSASASIDELNNNAESWNIDDTQYWFKRKDLKNMYSVFPNCTGKMLKDLWERKQMDYKEFNRFINKEIENSNEDISLQEKLDFYENLQNLFS